MKPILSLCLCLALCAAAYAEKSAGSNWPSFRGPNASGVAEGAAPTTWDATRSVNVLWKTPIPGLAHSSPVVWGDRMFITTAIGGDPQAVFNPKAEDEEKPGPNLKYSWRLYCLDKRSGKVLWEKTAHEGVPRAGRHRKASFSNSTPATDGRYVVALFDSEGMFCYDIDGKLLWKQDLGVLNPGYAEDPTSSWGHSSSPIIYKDMVIVQCDGHAQSFMAAYDLKDGKRVWQVQRGELPTWSTPAIYEGGGRAQLLSNGGRYLRGYDPVTGRELWRFSDNGTQVKMPTPVIARDLIIMTGGWPEGRPIYAIRASASGDISLKAGQETNPHLAWRTGRGSAYTGTPLAYGDYMYICTDKGVLSAYDVKTGERLYQQRVGDKSAGFSASPVAADGKLYLASEDGEVFVVKAGPKYELLAANPMNEPLMATPAITDGVIFVRGQRHVFAIGAK